VKLLATLLCAVLPHRYAVDRLIAQHWRKLRCTRCDKCFSLHDRTHTLIPWDDDLEQMASVRASLGAPDIKTAPFGRDVLVFNDYFGWYRSRATVIGGRVCWPLHGLLGRHGGVWYPVPSRWMELPLVPAGRKWCGISTMPPVPDHGTYGVAPSAKEADRG